MTLDQIKAEYPKFRQWIKETKGYLTCDNEYLIALWYEYLKWKKKKGEGDEGTINR